MRSWDFCLAIHQGDFRNPAERLVLYELAIHWNERTGRCDPSINRLAMMTGMSNKTIGNAIDRLVERGVLEVVRASRRESRNYVLRLDASDVDEHDSDDASDVDEHDSDSESGRSTPLSDVDRSPSDVDRAPESCPTGNVLNSEENSVGNSAGEDAGHPAVANGGKPPPCPQMEIVNLYHKILHELPKVKDWHPGRRELLRSRWREDPKRQELDYWRKLFEYIKKSPFLMGKVEGRDGDSFECDLEWIVTRKNFAKIIEKRYHRRRPE